MSKLSSEQGQPTPSSPSSVAGRKRTRQLSTSHQQQNSLASHPSFGKSEGIRWRNSDSDPWDEEEDDEAKKHPREGGRDTVVNWGQQIQIGEDLIGEFKLPEGHRGGT